MRAYCREQRSILALMGILLVLVGAVFLCLDRSHNGDFYLSLMSGRFVSQHGVVAHDPFATIGHGGAWLNQQWLSELAFFHAFESLGPTGLTVLYALMITAPLALMLWLCRSKGWRLLVVVTAFYIPGVLAVIHPRAAGFTVLIFTVLGALLVALSRERGGQANGAGTTREWAIRVGVVALFALWANLHGGFIAGLLLLVLATAGMAIDHWRGVPGGPPLSRVVALGALALLAAATVTVATPLGAAIWSYLASFQNQAIEVASTEWQSAFSSPFATVYLVLAACFSGWLWARSPRPRRATTLLVTAGFLLFAGYSIRNLIFVGPVLALLVAWTAPNRRPAPLRVPIAFAGAAAAAASLVWVAFLGPARDDPSLGLPVADYAIAHPPPKGRLVTYAGVGSYINWRSPQTKVVLNGWLESFSGEQLRDNYGVLRAGTPLAGDTHLAGALRRLRVGGVIAHVPTAIRHLEAAGFVPVYASPEGTYLIRPR